MASHGEWDDRYLRQATRGVASRVRKHGVASPGTAAGGVQALRKKPCARTKGPAQSGVGPRPQGGQCSHPALAAAAPTKEGSQGGVTRKELEPYLKLGAWPCAREGPVIKVGSDCSGLESVVAALHQMGLGDRVKLEFVCDLDPGCRKFLQTVHKPTSMYDNIKSRDVESMPEVDLYSAGFPCQPWSPEGKGQGRRDQKGRGDIFDYVLEYINAKLPK